MRALDESRTRINGKFMAENSGKPITIVGEITTVNSNGSTFEIKSTDNQLINVVLNEPLDRPVNGWVEIRGTAQGRTNVICQDFIELSPAIMSSFAVETYDDLVTVINSSVNPYSSDKS